MQLHLPLLGLLLLCRTVSGQAQSQPDHAADFHLAPPPLGDADPVEIDDHNDQTSRHRRSVDNFNLAAVKALFIDEYLDSSNDKYSWDGSTGACREASADIPHEQQVVKRINYMRSMVGLPAVTLNSAQSKKCRDAALVFSANNVLAHSLANNLQCWSQDGSDAALSSNIAIGNQGVDAVNAYIDDNGGNNAAVGHRRWLLWPRLGSVGTGDAGTANWSPAPSNAMWVIGNGVSRANTAFVAWPSPGYFPYQVLPSSRRWSFSVNGADFNGATATVTGPSGKLNVGYETVYNGYADNTFVFLVDVFGRPSQEETYTVTVNYKQSGAPTSTTYSVTVFDPVDGGAVFCNRLRVSGRTSSNTLINGVYSKVDNTGSEFNNIPYYQKSNGFTLRWQSQQWRFMSSPNEYAFYAYINENLVRPEDKTSAVLVWAGSWESDPAVDIVCEDYPSSDESSSTTPTTPTTTKATTTTTEDSSDPCEGILTRSSRKKCKRKCGKLGLQFEAYYRNGAPEVNGCRKGCVCCPERVGKNNCINKCGGRANMDWTRRRADGCQRVCTCKN